MKKIKPKIRFLLLICLWQSKIFAQETTTASGGNASGAGGSVSYSVGQILYSTQTGTSGSLSQGVQQAFEISVISGIDTPDNVLLSCETYPNPTTNNLKLKIENKEDKSFKAQLFDINGKLLSVQEITIDETIIPMEQFPAQTYILKISNNNQQIKTFKIIKK